MISVNTLRTSRNQPVPVDVLQNIESFLPKQDRHAIRLDRVCSLWKSLFHRNNPRISARPYPLLSHHPSFLDPILSPFTEIYNANAHRGQPNQGLLPATRRSNTDNTYIQLVDESNVILITQNYNGSTKEITLLNLSNNQSLYPTRELNNSHPDTHPISIAVNRLRTQVTVLSREIYSRLGYRQSYLERISLQTGQVQRLQMDDLTGTTDIPERMFRISPSGNILHTIQSNTRTSQTSIELSDINSKTSIKTISVDGVFLENFSLCRYSISPCGNKCLLTTILSSYPLRPKEDPIVCVNILDLKTGKFRTQFTIQGTKFGGQRCLELIEIDSGWKTLVIVSKDRRRQQNQPVKLQAFSLMHGAGEEPHLINEKILLGDFRVKPDSHSRISEIIPGSGGVMTNFVFSASLPSIIPFARNNAEIYLWDFISNSINSLQIQENEDTTPQRYKYTINDVQSILGVDTALLVIAKTRHLAHPQHAGLRESVVTAVDLSSYKAYELLRFSTLAALRSGMEADVQIKVSPDRKTICLFIHKGGAPLFYTVSEDLLLSSVITGGTPYDVLPKILTEKMLSPKSLPGYFAKQIFQDAIELIRAACHKGNLKEKEILEDLIPWHIKKIEQLFPLNPLPLDKRVFGPYATKALRSLNVFLSNIDGSSEIKDVQKRLDELVESFPGMMTSGDPDNPLNPNAQSFPPSKLVPK